ncbi:circadian clock protein KaiC [Desulfacinum hydrothermale DSM 13146]|uniref:Circadian clock protein KaiC n=1 Tax=Desulfacinum hydrothermale DSM 13146 TaxID=1121390 RepID=A0A1W1XFZ7_9BACT|nr:hypothetical protein [Desulfacinum hydrothermale]SMC22893.1 circadian clock protein KaiC [Desulfacinum hydrothermale DSM 13146]
MTRIQNFINYRRSHKVTLMLEKAQEAITDDVRITDLGVIYTADNVTVLRWAEYNGRGIKAVSCLKKRLGDFEPEPREFQITGDGIVVGESLGHLRGLLTGVPAAEQEKPEYER